MEATENQAVEKPAESIRGNFSIFLNLLAGAPARTR
jgi:hypothetical protein